MWKKIDRGFLRFDNNPESLRDISNNELYSWKKLFWPANNTKKKNKFWSTMSEEN